MMKDIVFAGTPDFAAFHLQTLIDSGYTPSLVLTQPDRGTGRGRKLKPSPVKATAELHNLTVFQPEKIDTETQSYLLNTPKPDLLIVVAYGLILPQWMLDWATHGSVNVHASLLPRWRGAAPIQRAIEAGDTESGIGIMQMDIGLDTGDVWAETAIPITDTTNAHSLHDQLQQAGATTLIEMLPMLLSGNGKPKKQSENGVTYATKLSKQEAQINWDETADIIYRKIRAFNPVPIAHSETTCGQRYRFYEAQPMQKEHSQANGSVLEESKNGIVIACKDGSICVTELQEIGKKRLAVADFLNGKSLREKIFI